MFDIGGWEFLAIVILAIVIIGPKDLPATVRTVTMWARKARALAGDFRSGLDDLAREVELDEVKNTLTQGLDGGGLGSTIGEIRDDIERSIDPTGEVADAFDTADEFPDMPPGDEDEYDGMDDQGDDQADPIADTEDGEGRIADAEEDTAAAADDAPAGAEAGEKPGA